MALCFVWVGLRWHFEVSPVSLLVGAVRRHRYGKPPSFASKACQFPGLCSLVISGLQRMIQIEEPFFNRSWVTARHIDKITNGRFGGRQYRFESEFIVFRAAGKSVVSECMCTFMYELSAYHLLQDTSLNIHTLNSKIQAYHHEQNAAVEIVQYSFFFFTSLNVLCNASISEVTMAVYLFRAPSSRKTSTSVWGTSQVGNQQTAQAPASLQPIHGEWSGTRNRWSSS